MADRARRATIHSDGFPARGPATAGPSPPRLARPPGAAPRYGPPRRPPRASRATAGSTVVAGCPCRCRRCSPRPSSRSAIGVLWVAQRRVRTVRERRRRAASAGLSTRSARPSAARTPTQAPPTSDAPSIVSPSRPYTNDDAVDITVNVPRRRRRQGRLHAPAVRRRSGRRGRTLVDRGSRSAGPRSRSSPASSPQQGPQRLPGGDQRARAARASGPRSRPGCSTLEAQAHDHLAQGRARPRPRTPSRSRARPRPAARSGSRTTTTARSVNVKASKDGLFDARIAHRRRPQRDPHHGDRPGRQPERRALTIRKGSGKTTASSPRPATSSAPRGCPSR